MPAPTTDLDEEIAALVAQREAGRITWAEFDRRKAALLVKPERPEPQAGATSPALKLALVVVILVIIAIVALGVVGR